MVAFRLLGIFSLSGSITSLEGKFHLHIDARVFMSIADGHILKTVLLIKPQCRPESRVRQQHESLGPSLSRKLDGSSCQEITVSPSLRTGGDSHLGQFVNSIIVTDDGADAHHIVI